MSIRAHLEMAQLALMEAQAQARINEDRAIYGASAGQLRPIVRTAATLANIGLIIHQLNHLIAGQADA